MATSPAEAPATAQPRPRYVRPARPLTDAELQERINRIEQERVEREAHAERAARHAQLVQEAVTELGPEAAARLERAGVIAEMAQEWALQVLEKRWGLSEPTPPADYSVLNTSAAHQQGRSEARPSSRSSTRSSPSSSDSSSSDPPPDEPPLRRCTRPTCLGRGRSPALPTRAVCWHCFLVIGARADELRGAS